MSIKYKDGVTGDPQPALQSALITADIVYGWFGSDLTITAIRNGDHKPGSLHAKGYAADCRITDIPGAMRPALFAAIKGKLGAAYDVVLEGDTTPGASAPHIHLEFDPEHNGGVNLP